MGHGFQFLASHGFTTKCTCSGTVGLEGGDGVDYEAVDVRDSCGRNEGCRQVFGRLDCRKSTLEEDRDGVVLGRADGQGHYPLALGQRIEKVGEQVVVVYKRVVFRHDRDVDWTSAIEQAEILCQNTCIRCTGLYENRMSISKYIKVYESISLHIILCNVPRKSSRHSCPATVMGSRADPRRFCRADKQAGSWSRLSVVTQRPPTHKD